MKITKLSEQKLQELKNELEHLKTTEMADVVEAIKAARAFGDLYENSEYDEAKDRQGKLYSRIAEIEAILENYEIIAESDDTTAVRVGCTVVICFAGETDPEEYTLVGTHEVDITRNRISEESLVGKSMIGLKVGDVGFVDAPVGKLEYKVLEIRK